MVRTNVPQSVRALRRRKGWRQSDLAERSSVSRELISRIERVGSALSATVGLVLRWEGAELDRLVDARHARLQEGVAALLVSRGWGARAEVSFNQYGDRGRVDVLAFHPPTRTLLVVEVKSAIGDLHDALGRLDVKVRLAKPVAAGAGWTDVGAVVPCLVVGDTRASRRVVAQHTALFSRFAKRGRTALDRIRNPVSPAPSGLLWFVKMPNSRDVTTIRVRRVRNHRNAR
jgi:transcriptional regulator with XRE-family HTH domain